MRLKIWETGKSIQLPFLGDYAVDQNALSRIIFVGEKQLLFRQCPNDDIPWLHHCGPTSKILRNWLFLLQCLSPNI